MSASNAFETALLLLICNNTSIANIGDTAGLPGAATAGSLYIALHTADPGEAGTQATSEATYTSYARVAVARSSAGFTVTGNAAANAAEVAFPTCTGGTNNITHFSIGTAATGAGTLLFSGTLTAPLSVSTGVPPKFAVGALTVTAD